MGKHVWFGCTVFHNLSLNEIIQHQHECCPILFTYSTFTHIGFFKNDNKQVNDVTHRKNVKT